MCACVRSVCVCGGGDDECVHSVYVCVCGGGGGDDECVHGCVWWVL